MDPRSGSNQLNQQRQSNGVAAAYVAYALAYRRRSGINVKPLPLRGAIRRLCHQWRNRSGKLSKAGEK